MEVKQSSSLITYSLPTPFIAMPFDNAGFWLAPEAINPDELSKPHPPSYKYQYPIPECTSQTPTQLLKAHYGREPDLQSLQVTTFLDYPQYTAAPIGSLGLIGRWPRPQGPGGVVSVPVEIPGGEPVQGFSKIEVEFRCEKPDGPSKGVSLGALYSPNPVFMANSNDLIEHQFTVLGRSKHIEFTIAWPGYKPEKYGILNKQQSNLPLTRCNLGMQIALAYAAFFKTVEEKRRLPNKPGFFNIALHQGKNSRPDSLGLQLGNLYLMRFRNTAGRFWVADIEVA